MPGNTDSYCERCGTRYVFRVEEAQRFHLGQAVVFAKGIRNFIVTDGQSLADSMALARRESETSDGSKIADAFQRTFNFCMVCRQYACDRCWNPGQLACLTCAPLTGTEQETVAESGAAGLAPREGDESSLFPDILDSKGAPLEYAAAPLDWPASDLPAPGDEDATPMEAATALPSEPPEDTSPETAAEPDLAEPRDEAAGVRSVSVEHEGPEEPAEAWLPAEATPPGVYEPAATVEPSAGAAASSGDEQPVDAAAREAAAREPEAGTPEGLAATDAHAVAAAPGPSADASESARPRGRILRRLNFLGTSGGRRQRTSVDPWPRPTPWRGLPHEGKGWLNPSSHRQPAATVVPELGLSAEAGAGMGAAAPEPLPAVPPDTAGLMESLPEPEGPAAEAPEAGAVEPAAQQAATAPAAPEAAAPAAPEAADQAALAAQGEAVEAEVAPASSAEPAEPDRAPAGPEMSAPETPSRPAAAAPAATEPRRELSAAEEAALARIAALGIEPGPSECEVSIEGSLASIAGLGGAAAAPAAPAAKAAGEDLPVPAQPAAPAAPAMPVPPAPRPQRRSPAPTFGGVPGEDDEARVSAAGEAAAPTPGAAVASDDIVGQAHELPEGWPPLGASWPPQETPGAPWPVGEAAPFQPAATGDQAPTFLTQVWVQSSEAILSRGAARVCHGCSLPLSTHARFCRRCGVRQG